jgi:uncharacterized membrane protein YcjF (UPF0283 family)
MSNDLNIVHNFKTNIDSTLNAQDEYTSQIRRSYMYEFILLFIVAIIVLVITISNMTSDTATTAGQVFCWIILIWVVIVIVVYIAHWIDSIKLPSVAASASDSGPIIRIHYV